MTANSKIEPRICPLTRSSGLTRLNTPTGNPAPRAPRPKKRVRERRFQPFDLLGSPAGLMTEDVLHKGRYDAPTESAGRFGKPVFRNL
jgi:hypothetical protein